MYVRYVCANVMGECKLNGKKTLDGLASRPQKRIRHGDLHSGACHAACREPKRKKLGLSYHGG